ncbi:MAG: AAA family ATPase, partial [bacterium]|nr:AAA family ATPase [bacterium]
MGIVLLCDRCRGTARVAGVACRACAGSGAAAAWGTVMLTWSLPIDRRSARGRRVESIVRAVVAMLCVLASGLSFAWYVRTGGDMTILGRLRALVDAPTYAILPFWAGVLLVMIAGVQAMRSTDRRQATAVTAGATTTEPPPLTTPPSWAAVMSVPHVDIAARFHPDAIATLERASAFAERFRHQSVLPIHVFAAILSAGSGATLFSRLGTDFEGLKTRIRNALGKVSTFEQAVVVAPETFEAIFTAYTAAAARRRFIGTLDILTVLSAGEGIVRDILDDLGVTHQHVVNVATWVRVREEIRERYRRYHARGALRPKHGMNRAMTAIATPILDAFGEDLTALASAGYVGPVVDRTREFREVFRIFESGRHGVVLVGAAGVGKSAIIEGLAERMAADDVPALLQDKRLVRLSVARLTSGAAPAVAQERLMAALGEASRSKNIVLVVESLEHLVGVASGGAAAIDLGDVLATEMERTGMVLVGATTPEAYRQFIERSSLGGILERIAIEEPEGDDAIQIIEARSILVEGQQRVFFSYGAIEACVSLSSRYLHDRYLPEKAVALMEEVATMVRTSRGEGQIVTAADVGAIIEEKTGIPAAEVTADEAQKLLHLEEEMHRRIIGQDEAVNMIAAALRRARVSLREGKRPIATFLFLGPTGVGKTELAKTVAATYFGQDNAMVRLDMSEYQDASSASRLIGAPPGYSGAESGGQLTEAVRQNPFTLVLLDELEKAHPDILNLFLQVF